ncbi:MAG TPA: hypothetical protein PKA64_07855 [Myxococcota bacterium]|nr:hypothetical protein [Myxococcota bacterium]
MIPTFVFLASTALGAAPAIRFELSSAAPSSGERVLYRVAWTNDSTAPVRVPADLFDHLRVRTLVELPWEKSGTVYQEGPAEAPEQRPAADIGWQTVAPFTTIERVGDLAQFIPQCRDGCITSDYQIRASLAAPPSTGLANDQLVPEGGTWDFQLEIRPPLLALQGAAAARLEVTAVDLDKNVATVQVRVHNPGTIDAYYPDTAARLEGCSWQWTRGGRTESSAARLQSSPGGVPWHEADGLIVPAGGSVDTTVTCTAPKLPGGGKDAMVSVTIRPTHLFVPMKRPRTPLWIAGERTSEPAPVKP